MILETHFFKKIQTVAYAVTSGGGEGPIVLDDVSCNGTESKLTGCQASQTSDCQHIEDAGVICHAGMLQCTNSISTSRCLCTFIASSSFVLQIRQ